MIPSEYSFQFKRVKFSVKMCFTIAISRFKVKNLKFLEFSPEKRSFSHAQFYVECSKVGIPSSLDIFVPEERTSNIEFSLLEIVLKKTFQNKLSTL